MEFTYCPYCGESLKEEVVHTAEIGETDQKIIYKTTLMKIRISAEELELSIEKFKNRKIT